MPKWLRTTVRISSTALFIAASAVLLALFLPGSLKILSVQTGSMEPVLSPGDLIIVRKQPVANYRPGDVITFINPADRSQTITHRIVERADGPYRSVFTTKGDANATADRAISENLILGRQVASVPLLGRVVDFTRTLPGLLLVIWLPALWIIAGETRRLTVYFRQSNVYRYVPGREIIRPLQLRYDK